MNLDLSERPSMCTWNFDLHKSLSRDYSQRQCGKLQRFSVSQGKQREIMVSFITIIMSRPSKITFSKQNAVTFACKIALDHIKCSSSTRIINVCLGVITLESTSMETVSRCLKSSNTFFTAHTNSHSLQTFLDCARNETLALVTLSYEFLQRAMFWFQRNVYSCICLLCAQELNFCNIKQTSSLHSRQTTIGPLV